MRRFQPFLSPHLPVPLLNLGIRKISLWLLPPQVKAYCWDCGALRSVVSPQYEELMEVVSRAVSKVNIDWLAESTKEKKVR